MKRSITALTVLVVTFAVTAGAYPAAAGALSFSVDSSSLVATDTVTQTLAWTYTPPSPQYVGEFFDEGSEVLASVYECADGSSACGPVDLVALDYSTGAVLWATGSGVWDVQPVNDAFVGLLGGRLPNPFTAQVVSVDASTGHERWSTNLLPNGSPSTYAAFSGAANVSGGLISFAMYVCQLDISCSPLRAFSLNVTNGVPVPTDAPSISDIQPLAGGAVVTFTPESNFLATPTQHRVDCASTDGGQSVSVTSASASPISITGLTNGHTYTCSMTAITAGGTGPTSVASSQFVAGQSASISSQSIIEGNQGGEVMYFPVVLSNPARQRTAIPFEIQPGTATASDLKLGHGQVVFTPSKTTGLSATVKYIAVRIYPDTSVEPDETFSVQLTSAPTGWSLAQSEAIGTIVDDDGQAPSAAPRVSIADESIVEGNIGAPPKPFTVARVAVTLDRPPETSCSVVLTVSDGSAIGGSDFVPLKPRIIKFKAGQQERTVNVSILPDRVVESDETISLILSSPTEDLLGRAVANLTIFNDDSDL